MQQLNIPLTGNEWDNGAPVTLTNPHKLQKKSPLSFQKWTKNKCPKSKKRKYFLKRAIF